MAHRAEALYLAIVQSSDPVDAIRAMVDRHEPENEVLEFKGMDKLGVRDQAVKAYWSQALSGFANTGGGVLIWGVDARKDQSTGIDGASSLALCPSANALESTLKGCFLQTTTDVVENVRMTSIIFDQSGSGVVICWVGEGANKPYRAELEKSRQYYMRVQDKFVVMPHALLRSLFYPIFTPRVEAIIEIGETPQPFIFEFGVVLTNKGTATAGDVMVVIYTTCPMKLTAWNIHSEWTTATVSGKEADAFKFIATRSIHPGQRTYLAGFTWALGNHPATPNPKVGFLIRILSLNQQADDVSAIFDKGEIFGKNKKVAGAPEQPFDDPKSPFYFITASNKGI